ncbi:hypothetical protein L7F22_004753 [Adiantum nelumboides]|nr:hypothetical protein [Adiantum nelumboides]
MGVSAKARRSSVAAIAAPSSPAQETASTEILYFVNWVSFLQTVKLLVLVSFCRDSFATGSLVQNLKLSSRFETVQISVLDYWLVVQVLDCDWLAVQVAVSGIVWLAFRSLAEVQEVERYILAAREKEIESLRKAEQRRATLEKAPMTSANPLQSPELTTLKSQPIGSHIASGSKDTPNAAILDGVFLNENWEYNLQTEKLTDLYTSYTYHVGWLDIIQATSNSTSVDEQQRMICDVIHSIVQMERQNLGINMPSMGPMKFLDTTKAKQPTTSQMETPSVSSMDRSYIVSPGVSMQSEPTHGSFSFLDLVQPSLGDLPTPTMNMTGGATSTLLASTTPLHTSVAPMPKPVGVHQPYVPVATHPYVAPMPPPNPITYVPQSHYPSPYFSGAVPAGINTSYPTSAIPEPTSTSFRPSLGAVPYEVWDPRRVRMPRPKPANPFPYVVPRVPTPIASTSIVPTHLGDLAVRAGMRSRQGVASSPPCRSSSMAMGQTNPPKR